MKRPPPPPPKRKRERSAPLPIPPPVPQTRPSSSHKRPPTPPPPPITRRSRLSDEYLAYIASDAWKARRKRALHRAGYRCERCGRRTKPLHVHHHTYARLGHERDEDLAVLCPHCHRFVHRERRERRERRYKKSRG